MNGNANMYEKLRIDAYDANMMLQKYGLIDLTFGNASVIDRDEGVVAIKPSGVPYDTMTPDHMVLLDLDGKSIDGDLRPSSDTPTHLLLYKAFDSIGGVVHTHSRYATSFAQAGRPVECYGTTHADFFYGEIPVTRKLKPEEIAGDYELEVGNVIVERFSELSYEAHPGVLVNCHGPFAWGPTGKKAVENAFAIELLAQMALNTLALSPEIAPIQKELLDKHFLRKHGKNAYYGQS